MERDRHPWEIASFAIHFVGRITMLRWAIAFFIIALIAAVLGFGGIAVAAAGIAKIIFYIFLALFIISLISHLASRT